MERGSIIHLEVIRLIAYLYVFNYLIINNNNVIIYLYYNIIIYIIFTFILLYIIIIIFIYLFFYNLYVHNIPTNILGSYNTRCMTAVSAFNFGPEYIRRLFKTATKESPGKFTKRFISKLVRAKEVRSKKKKKLNFKP